MDLGLKGKLAIVTGKAVDIGKRLCSVFREKGRTVVIADINVAKNAYRYDHSQINGD